MARLSRVGVLLVVGIGLLLMGLLFVGIGSAGQCNINGLPAPPEECFRIFVPVGYGLLALGGILVVGGFLMRLRR